MSKNIINRLIFKAEIQSVTLKKINYIFFQKSSNDLTKLVPKTEKFAFNQICISEPEDKSPEETKLIFVEEKQKLTPTITEESISDSSKKSSLSLQVEPVSEQKPDKRKLSVHGLMAFAERRRSSGAIMSDARKMSIANGEGIPTGIRSPIIGTGTSFYHQVFVFRFLFFFFF